MKHPISLTTNVLRRLDVSPRSGRIQSLDGLRAVSIIMVLLSHASAANNFPVQNPTVRSYLAVGDLGVRVFFVISGFLITSLLLRELRATQRISLPHFYFRRTLRIFPPFYAFIGVLILLNVSGVLRANADPVLPYISALLYFKNYVNSDWYIAHAWSLSVEEQFYILWPTVLLLARGRAFWIAGAMLLACPLIHLFYATEMSWLFEFGYRFETVADAIAIGCLLAANQERLRRWMGYARFQESTWFLVVPLIALVADAASTRTRIGPVEYGLLGTIAAFSVMNLAIALSIDWCLRFPGSMIGRVLNARPLVIVGVLSYSIYIWQQIFLDPDAVLLEFPWSILPVLPVAMVSYLLVERPALRLRSHVEARLFSSKPIVPHRVEPHAERVPVLSTQ